MKTLIATAFTLMIASNTYASCQNVSFQLERISGFDSRCSKVLPEG